MGSSRYQKHCKTQAQLTTTITRVHHTGMKNHGSDYYTQIRISEQCSRTNQYANSQRIRKEAWTSSAQDAEDK